jgi:hypothetical protein
LRALALGEQRQGLACDVTLEMRAVLVCLERRLVAEQFVEQELRRVLGGAADQE